MRRIVVLTSVAALTVSGLLTASMGTALASGSAPAPRCTSQNSQIACFPSVPVSPVTWTETISQYGTSYTSTFSAPSIRGACSVGAGYSVSYSYVSGGVTFSSPVTTIVCSKLPPE
jgi:hypothetical protein